MNKTKSLVNFLRMNWIVYLAKPTMMMNRRLTFPSLMKKSLRSHRVQMLMNLFQKILSKKVKQQKKSLQ